MMILKREQIETEQVIAARPAQTTVEAEIALPGGLREEARVYDCGATARITGAETGGSRLTAEGRVTFRALYAQGDLKKISSVEATADFTQALPLISQPEGAQTLPATARAEVISAAAKAYGGRLMLSAVLRLTGETVVRRKMSVVTGVESDQPPIMKTEDIDIERETGEGEGDALIRETAELPAALGIQDTLFATADAQIEDILPGADGTTAVTGVMHVEAYHYTGNPAKPLVKTRHALPFEQAVSLSGSPGDRVRAQTEVRDVAVLLNEGETPEMRVEIQLHTRVTMTENETKTVLSDAFLTEGDAWTNEEQTARFRCGSVSERVSEAMRLSPALPENAPKMRAVTAAFVRLTPLSAERQGAKLVVEGVAQCSLIYQTDDSDLPASAVAEEPFRLAFETAALPTDAFSLSASDVEAAAVTGGHADIKGIVTLTATNVRRREAAFVTDVTAAPAQPPEKGFTLYYAQPGEDLWEVCKRRRVSPERVRALNPDLPEELSPGTPVVICRL